MDERERFEKWFSQSANERIKTDMIQLCYWDGRGDLYGEAVNLAWQAWQAAQAAPKPSECRALVPVHAESVDGPEGDLRPLTPWQFVCMLILLTGDVVHMGFEVLCAFALDPIYCVRWLLVVSKRRLRQAGVALADAMA